MTQTSLFLKKDKIKPENAFYPASKSFLDVDGNPILWEVKRISSRENGEIQDACLELKGKKQTLNANKYIRKAIAASVVYPDLQSVELQDSYGVKTPEDLIVEMIDGAGEWNAFAEFFNDLNGFGGGGEDDVKTAKN